MTRAEELAQVLPKLTIPKLPESEPRSAEATQQLKERIKTQLKAQNAVLVAHYYTAGELQDLAEETGGCVADSLEMARFGTVHPATTLVVAGVRFMGETSKILNQEKRVLMPDLNATCSLDEGCPPELFAQFCDEHPDRTVVVYANTSAAVKARADWMVTSGIALPIVQHLADQGKKILWAPDRHLGSYVQRQTKADILLWPGACVVHEGFRAEGLAKMRQQHPQAGVLVHPEAPQAVVEQADVVGSTAAMIQAVQNMPNQEFIVATEPGIFNKMRQLAPNKHLMVAPTMGEGATCESCARCVWMAMNSLEKVAQALEQGTGEIHVDPAVAAKARLPIRRMLDFAQQQKK